MADPSSFFFANAKPGDPLSYEALQTRRKIAEQLMGKRSPFPKTFGEGLTYLGEGIGDAMQMNRLDEAERAQERLRAQAVTAAARAGGLTPDENTAVAPAAGRADAGTDATSLQTAAAPYSAPGAAPGNIPLPPPRPARLRDAQLAQLQEDPAVLRRAAAMTQGEVDPRASTAERQTQFASALDRAGARNIPVAQALETYTGPGSRGYYPPDAFARGEQALQKPGAYEAFQRDIATPVLRGADPGAAALGFTPTGNASGGVASRGIARGLYNASGRFPGSAETYVQQEPPSQLARLEAGRNRIAAAATPGGAAALPYAAPDEASQSVQTAALTTPGVTSDASPAASAVQAVAALPTQQSPPAQTPPLIPGGPPIRSPIPLAPSEIRTPGVQTAQAATGVGTVPGPLDQRSLPPSAPPTGMVPPETLKPLIPPIQPKPTPVGPVEQMAILESQKTGNPNIQAPWLALAAREEAKRKQADVLNNETYKSDLEEHRARVKERETYALSYPEKKFTQEQERLKAEREAGDRTRYGLLGREGTLKAVEKSAADVAPLPEAMDAINKARALVTSGTFTGLLGPAQLLAAKAKALLPGQAPDPAIANTEAFRATVSRMIGGMRANVAGPGSQSNAELQILLNAAGGGTQQEKDSILEVLGNLEKSALRGATQHHLKLLTAAGRDPDERQTLYNTYGLPMEAMLPQSTVEKFKRHFDQDPEAAIERIDKFYHRPGLGQKILQSGR